MRIILTVLFSSTVTFGIWSQTCNSGKLDPRVEKSLRRIGDLKPRLDRVPLEQATQDKLDREQLYPENDVVILKITADSIPVYVFNASHDENLPVVLYFHPGGFVTPFLPFMKYDCWTMSKDLRVIVIAVDYRIAPAFKFPAAVDDAYRSFEWVLDNGARFGGDMHKLVVAGVSAGANLAAVVSQKAKNNSLASSIKLQVLNCPSVDNINHQPMYPSYAAYATGYFLTQPFILFAQKAYADEKDFTNPEFAPLLAKDFRGLPPAVIFTTEFDILRDEAMAYVVKLRKANVKVWHHCFAGQIHCLVGLPAGAKEFQTLNQTICTAMVEVFKNTQKP